MSDPPFKSVEVIVVADNDADVPPGTVPPGILEVLGPTTMLKANDDMRLYIRKTHWDNMKDSYKLTEG